MKKHYLFPAVFFLSFFAHSQHIIKGEIQNSHEPFLIDLKELNGYDWNIIDNTMVRKNKFEFSLPENQKMIYLESKNSENLYIKLYNVKGTTVVTYDLENHSYTLSGTSLNSGFSKYMQFIQPFEEEINTHSKNVPKVSSFHSRDEEEDKLMTDYMDQLRRAKNELELAKFDFIHQNPDNDYTNILIEEKLKIPFDESYLDLLQRFHSDLNTHYKQTQAAQELLKWIKSYETVRIGAKAPEFTIPDTENQPQQLYKNLGKYTIVDFWASWCAPCRKENPNIIASYNKYKDQGLKIIGVSLDRDKDRWIKAIEKDHLSWLQVSNLKHWDDPVVELYKVSSIPKMYILDKNGVIVARDLRGKELSDKLEELFSK